MLLVVLLAVMVWVVEVAADPVTEPLIVSVPAPVLLKANAELAEFRMSAVLTVFAPEDCWKIPEEAPVPPIVIEVPPVIFVVGPTFGANVMLLASREPVTVILPVFVVA